MTEQKIKQLSLNRNFTIAEKISLCHSRIPEMRTITGFLDTGLIAPLPIWSPIPEKYQKTAQDDFSVWGLEAQHPKYLPEKLKPFVRFNGRGMMLLLEGAYKP